MTKNLDRYIRLAQAGTCVSVDMILADINMDMSIALSKIIDYSLSFVQSDEGVERMAYYLFHGTQIQRNYCTLYFNRRGDWRLVRQAFEQGLIDEIQAFSR